MITIYRIYNPDGISYIGSTSRPLNKRLAEHKCQYKTRPWGIRDLLKKCSFTDLNIEALEVCTASVRYDRENYYIKKYSNINKCMASVGPLGFTPTAEQIKKSKNRLKKLWSKNRSAMLNRVNKHKTKDFQKMASAASHAKKYKNMPVKLLVLKSSGDVILKYKTYDELSKFLGVHLSTASKAERNKLKKYKSIYEFRRILPLV